MPGVSVTDTYDALLSSTLRNYRKLLKDNIFNKIYTLSWLRRNGRMRTEDGGYQIVEQLLYGTNDTVAFKSAYGQISTTPQDGITSAFYNWKELAGTISISRKEQRQNSGKHRILDLLKSKIKQTEMTMTDTCNTLLHANVSSEPTLNITPLTLIAYPHALSATTVGSLSSTTYSWWRPQVSSVGTYATNLTASMRTVYNNVSKAGVGPVSGIICTQTAFEYYEALGESMKRFPVVRNEKATLDLGFEVLMYKGADLFFDPAFASNTFTTGESMIMVVDDAISLVIDRESDFITTDFIEPENQTAKVAKVIAMLNLTCGNRRALGTLYGITA